MILEIPGIDELSEDERSMVARIAAWAIRVRRARAAAAECRKRLDAAISELGGDPGGSHVCENGRWFSSRAGVAVFWSPEVVELYERWEHARRACFEAMPR